MVWLAHGQGAALQAAELRQHELRGCDACQHGPCLIEKGASRLGQRDIPPDTLEQLRSMPALKRRNRGAGGGLRKIERLGPARDVLPFRHRDEYPKLLQGHLHTYSGGAEPRARPTHRKNRSF